MVNISDPNEWKRLSKLEPTTYECEELHPSQNQNHRVLENEADPKTRDMAGYIKTICVCVCGSWYGLEPGINTGIKDPTRHHQYMTWGNTSVIPIPGI